ncbi:MAG TPA: sugar ABC transporter permease [Anaerolineae bacterium]|nr:sugar ABC transporter permease [Anaerolineae bacterium]
MKTNDVRSSLRGLVNSIQRRQFYLSDNAFSMILMIPLLLWVTMTMVYPLFYGIQLSLTDQRLIGIEGNFIGLDNFRRILSNETVISGIWKSVSWTLMNGILQGILGLIVGILLERAFFARRAMRVWILLPWIVPTIAIAILWKWLLSATYGIVNYLLVELGILDVGFGFLANPDVALETSSAINAWSMFPFLSIIMLAGLLSIPREEYEAARIDGAGFWQELRFITIPYITPTLVVLGLIGTMWSFNDFNMLWLINKGGPAGATRTLPLIVYEFAFRNYFLGRAAAVGVFMMLVLTVFVILFMRMSRRTVGIFAPMEEEL